MIYTLYTYMKASVNLSLAGTVSTTHSATLLAVETWHVLVSTTHPPPGRAVAAIKLLGCGFRLVLVIDNADEAAAVWVARPSVGHTHGGLAVDDRNWRGCAAGEKVRGRGPALVQHRVEHGIDGRGASGRAACTRRTRSTRHRQTAGRGARKSQHERARGDGARRRAEGVGSGTSWLCGSE